MLDEIPQTNHHYRRGRTPMIHLKDFNIVIWVRQAKGIDETNIVELKRREKLVAIAEVSQYTKKDAMKTVFEALVGTPNNYNTPKANKDHDYLVNVLTDEFTICFDFLKKNEYEELNTQIAQGEYVIDPEAIKKLEQAVIKNNSTTLIVGHLFDDDPNNYQEDFTKFDTVFMLDLGLLKKKPTSVYDAPWLLELDTEFLRLDNEMTIRNEEDKTVSQVVFTNKYERWHFMYEQGHIENLDIDAPVDRKFGYVDLEFAKKQVRYCVSLKDKRREANHRMLGTYDWD